MEELQQRQGYRRIFKENQLTLGLFLPIESYKGSIPTMENQIDLIKRAETLGFGAVWVRDIPLHDPMFGDAGQMFDPWVYLGYVSAKTNQIALGTGSTIFTLQHPLQIAKAAASIDQLSKGRLLLGVASGDRPVEFPAFNQNFYERGDGLKESFYYVKKVLQEDFPTIDSPLGLMRGNADVLPKPYKGTIPLLITGSSRQSLEWIGQHSDGWIYYPRNVHEQENIVNKWRRSTPYFKPFLQSLYIDLTDDPHTPPTPIHLGFRSGRNHLISFLKELENIGVNHVMLNLKYGKRSAADVLEELGEEVLPEFPSIKK